MTFGTFTNEVWYKFFVELLIFLKKFLIMLVMWHWISPIPLILFFHKLSATLCVEDYKCDCRWQQYDERNRDTEREVTCVTCLIQVRDSEAVIVSAVVTGHDGVRHTVSLKPFVTSHLRLEMTEMLNRLDGICNITAGGYPHPRMLTKSLALWDTLSSLALYSTST